MLLRILRDMPSPLRPSTETHGLLKSPPSLWAHAEEFRWKRKHLGLPSFVVHQYPDGKSYGCNGGGDKPKDPKVLGGEYEEIHAEEALQQESTLVSEAYLSFLQHITVINVPGRKNRVKNVTVRVKSFPSSRFSWRICFVSRSCWVLAILYAYDEIRCQSGGSMSTMILTSRISFRSRSVKAVALLFRFFKWSAENRRPSVTSAVSGLIFIASLSLLVPCHDLLA